MYKKIAGKLFIGLSIFAMLVPAAAGTGLHEPLTRAEFAKMLAEFYAPYQNQSIEEEGATECTKDIGGHKYEKEVCYFMYKTGHYTTDTELVDANWNFYPDKVITRFEAAKFVNRMLDFQYLKAVGAISGLDAQVNKKNFVSNIIKLGIPSTKKVEGFFPHAPLTTGRAEYWMKNLKSLFEKEVTAKDMAQFLANRANISLAKVECSQENKTGTQAAICVLPLKEAPDKSIIRAQATKLMVIEDNYQMLLNIPWITPDFPDVTPDDWYYESIDILNDYSVFPEKSGENFSPNEPFTHADLQYWLLHQTLAFLG